MFDVAIVLLLVQKYQNTPLKRRGGLRTPLGGRHFSLVLGEKVATGAFGATGNLGLHLTTTSFRLLCTDVGVNLNPAQQINAFLQQHLACTSFRLLCTDVGVNLNPAQQINAFCDLYQRISLPQRKGRRVLYLC